MFSSPMSLPSLVPILLVSWMLHFGVLKGVRLNGPSGPGPCILPQALSLQDFPLSYSLLPGIFHKHTKKKQVHPCILSHPPPQSSQYRARHEQSISLQYNYQRLKNRCKCLLYKVNKITAIKIKKTVFFSKTITVVGPLVTSSRK